ncbi:hypothetical protein DY000_02045867 [Brassica cretica]|uniref:Neprosin PEP catalytic domain-containing protein n=1 Tax=Brassica cretica TaxID=69181 RepID=A0ABQ7EU90_BRACR|nr:hypothetical protein DY000_02045867 [Brassica cretica]
MPTRTPAQQFTSSCYDTCPAEETTSDGDVKDCVPTTKRPAFDHHFLKDHMIQMMDITVQFPKSAEPDLINKSAYMEGDKYYGAKATINVWELNIQLKNEFSFSQIWLSGGSSGHDLNSIEAG